MAEAYAKGDKTALWPSHFYGRTKEYVQVEKLAISTRSLLQSIHVFGAPGEDR
jgi:hypothetical protein